LASLSDLTTAAADGDDGGDATDANNATAAASASSNEATAAVMDQLTTALDTTEVELPETAALSILVGVSTLVSVGRGDDAGADGPADSDAAADADAGDAAGGAAADAANATAANATASDEGAILSPVTVAAAALIDAVLDSVPAADAELGGEAAVLLSSLMDDLYTFGEEDAQGDAANGTATSDTATAAAEQTAANVRSATESLAEKLLAGLDVAALADADAANAAAAAAAAANNAGDDVGSGESTAVAATREVALRSTNLNITVQARPASALVGTPIAIDETSVSLPAAVLGAVAGGAAGDGDGDNGTTSGGGTIGLLLYVSALNTHGGESATLTTSSPLVSFSLRQNGADLRIADLSSPIQLTLPLAGGATTDGACIGQPDAATASAEVSAAVAEYLGDQVGADEYAAAQEAVLARYCAEALECRYWDEAAAGWRTDGCRTVELDGTSEIGCECDHLTDFIAVRTPSSWGDFVDQALKGFSVNVFTWEQATTCLNAPRWNFVQVLLPYRLHPSP